MARRADGHPFPKATGALGLGPSNWPSFSKCRYGWYGAAVRIFTTVVLGGSTSAVGDREAEGKRTPVDRRVKIKTAFALSEPNVGSMQLRLNSSLTACDRLC